MKNIIFFTLLSISCFSQGNPNSRRVEVLHDTSFFSVEKDALVKVRIRTVQHADGQIEQITSARPLAFADTTAANKVKQEAAAAVKELKQKVKELQAQIKQIEDEAKFVDGEFQKKKGKKEAAPPVTTPAPVAPITPEQPQPKPKKKRKKQ